MIEEEPDVLLRPNEAQLLVILVQIAGIVGP